MANLLLDRLVTLKGISGLEVSWYGTQDARYFVFGPKNQPVKTVCTYPKAKMFAEGVAYGRKLNATT
jgi:hypothetical protein